MTKLPVTFESEQNINQVYDHYKYREVSYKKALAAHSLMALIFHPKRVWEPGVKARIQEHIEDQGNVIWIQNHTSYTNPLNVAAAALREKTLRPLVGNTPIMSKHSLFSTAKLYEKPQRIIVDAAGGVPVGRIADPELQKLANNRVIDLQVYRATEKGDHIDGFPQGHRSDPRVIGETMPGLAVIGCKLRDLGRNVLYLPTGFATQASSKLGELHPVMYFGQPFAPEGTPSDVNSEIQSALQHCVDRAFQHLESKQ